MNDRSLFIITDYFPPDPNNRSRRMYERAEYLATQGYQVTVFCPSRESQNKKDIPFHPNIEVIRIDPWFKRQGNTFQYWENNRLSKFFGPLLGYPRWVIPVALKMRKYDLQESVLYTINNPISLHFVGLLLRGQVKKWVAELRDPITQYEYSNRGRLGRYLDGIIEHLVVKRADLVVLRKGLQTSPRQLKHKYKAFAEKIVALPDYGANLADFEKLSRSANPLQERKIKGIYAGNFYGNEPLNALEEAVSKLNRKSNISLTIDIYGGSGNSKGDLTYHGRVPYWELLNYYETSQFSLVFDNSIAGCSDQGFIPSKMSELIALRKPILCIGNQASESAKIIRSNHIGITSNPNTVDIERGLREIFKMVKEKTFNQGYYDQVRNKISNERCEESFFNLVDEL